MSLCDSNESSPLLNKQRAPNLLPILIFIAYLVLRLTSIRAENISVSAYFTKSDELDPQLYAIDEKLISIMEFAQLTRTWANCSS